MRQNIPSDILDYKSTSSGLYIPKDYNFFVKPNDYNVTLRKLEEYNTWSNFVQWGRKRILSYSLRSLSESSSWITRSISL